MADGGLLPLLHLARRVEGCRACPRLVQWREDVARTKRAAYRDQPYWGRGVPGTGDPAARLLVLGLAPGAHGANRTGRPFEGDGTGILLFAAFRRAGFLRGGALVDCWLTNAVKCVPPGNTPTAEERRRCAPLLVEEVDALPLVVVLALGATAWDAVLRLSGPRPKPRFRHGAEVVLGPQGPLAGRILLASYHPSRQNTATGRLTMAMLETVALRAAALLPGGPSSRAPVSRG